ncbi:glycosyl transferase family 2 [Sphingomonas oleivorans]|uniref:Glycosyl transferase family 2 n=1 Tax=Sphingomonas oleivorans TaxID=1735121 RepID=A0A2T5FV47_9SPHN|nr:glycosyltransferase [Sphingomonas oleivorans]PTQ08606.1 glycosyl transferase family 2 [Sphingomonas oleivorans]
MAESAPNLSVIIPVYNDAGLLEGCLEALAQQSYPGKFETIVVDNGEIFSLEAIARRFPNVNFLWEPTPGSYQARNYAIRRSRGEVLAFTDADCRPHRDWLTNGVRALVADPGIGLVGGRVSVVQSTQGRPAMAELFDIVTAFPQKMYIETGNFAVTANMITRRKVIEQIGEFNAQLKSSGDKDFGVRVAAAGYRLVYVDDAVVEHPARSSNDEIFRKIRRSVGGSRDREPDWVSCMRFAIRFAIPPRRAIWHALTVRDPQLTVGKRIGVVGYCVLANWTRSVERVRLQISKAASARE